MSKRKPSKHSHSPKINAKAQRAAQAVVRSPSDTLRSRGAGSNESSPKPNDQKALVETPVTALQAESPPKHNDPNQEALLVENPAIALQDDCKQTMTDNFSKTAFDFSSAAANVQAYQARLGPVAGLVGIEGSVVSEVINLESSGVGAPDRRPRHDQRYHEVACPAV